MSANQSSDERDPVEWLAEEFVARHRRGECPLPAEYAEHYPQWADRIHALFPALLLMEHHKPGVGDPSDSSEDAGARAAPLEQLGDYRIIREVGRGGMAIVYEAEQVSLGRHVVLKVLPQQVLPNPKQQQRFEREARSAARLHHTNIVPVFGVGEEGGLHYYVMQYIQGLGLDEVLNELRRLKREKKPSDAGPMAGELKEWPPAMSVEAVARSLLTVGDEPPRRVPDPGVAEAEGAGAALASRRVDGASSPSSARTFSGSSLVLPGQSGEGRRSKAETYWHSVAHIGVQVAEALTYAHQQGVLHRDIKPSNLLLDLQGIVWITDFGLAKAADEADLTRTGDIIGTLRYMAPERFHGTSDPRSDVYGLGVTLYELLTLGPAFVGTDRERLIHQITQSEPPRPSQLNPEVPRDLETIVLKAIDREPSHRYQTADELGEDLQRFLDDRPIRARRASLGERAWRWCRRNPAVAGLAAAAFLAMAVGTVVSAGQAIRARRAVEAERAANAAARAREAEIRAVLEFVEERVLKAARPVGQAGGLGREVTLRQALDAALPAVAQDFAAQPLIEARLRRTLGQSYLYLGEPRTAAELYEASRALDARHRGPDDPETLRSMLGLAHSYQALGRSDEALKVFEETLARQKARLGPDHPDTLWSMLGVANSYQALGRSDEALKLHEETLALRKARLGPGHPDTLHSMNDLACSYYALGRHAEALKLFEETLALRKAKLGPDHPDTLWSMNGLAYSYQALGRYAEALKLHEETLALRKARLGPDHPDTLHSMNDLASSYQALGRHAEALKLFGETLALHKARLGPDHPDTLWSVLGLANSYQALGRHAEALKLFEETLALRQARLGPDHPDTLWSVLGLANSYQALGRHAEALKLREETLARRQARLGPDHPDVLTSMHHLAWSYQALGRSDEALKLFEEALARRKAKLGPDHPDTLWSMNNLAWSYYALGRHAEALKLFEETLALRKAKLGPDHPDTLVSRLGVASGLVQLGRGAEAAADCRRAAEAWEKLVGFDADSLYKYNAARFRAVTAAALRAADKSPAGAQQAEAEAGRAMAWLERAVAAGYHDAAAMAADHELDALRHRADFQELLARLSAARPK